VLPAEPVKKRPAGRFFMVPNPGAEINSEKSAVTTKKLMALHQASNGK
jgi:hypothetical protein